MGNKQGGERSDFHRVNSLPPSSHSKASQRVSEAPRTTSMGVSVGHTRSQRLPVSALPSKGWFEPRLF